MPHARSVCGDDNLTEVDASIGLFGNKLRDYITECNTDRGGY